MFGLGVGDWFATVALSAKKHIYKEVKRRCRFRKNKQISPSFYYFLMRIYAPSK